MALYTDLNIYKTGTVHNADGTVTVQDATPIYDSAAINNAIKNILLTRIGSLPGKPTFGCNLDVVLFSQLDEVTKSVAKKQIQISLVKWEKRIQVQDVIIKAVPEFNKLICTVHYTYRDKGLNVTEQISVSLAK